MRLSLSNRASFVKRHEAGSHESLCCWFHSLCAGPGVHTGSPVQPVLYSGLNPPAPKDSTHQGWTWKMLKTSKQCYVVYLPWTDKFKIIFVSGRLAPLPLTHCARLAWFTNKHQQHLLQGYKKLASSLVSAKLHSSIPQQPSARCQCQRCRILPVPSQWIELFDSVIYLDIVTSVGFGRAFRNSCTAEMSLSISSLVLMWWGSSAESHVNPAWCTLHTGDEEKRTRMTEVESCQKEGKN